MEESTVRWFSPLKGYGFLERDGKKDIFVHYTGINSDGFRVLTGGDRVVYDVGTQEDGRETAINVTVIQRGDSHGNSRTTSR